jgi:hypothetical protein
VLNDSTIVDIPAANGLGSAQYHGAEVQIPNDMKDLIGVTTRSGPRLRELARFASANGQGFVVVARSRYCRQCGLR